MFSIPINPYLTEKETVDIFIPFIQKYKDWIEDLYFTCKIPPFHTDVMGLVLDDDKTDITIKQALYIFTKTGIPITPVFNHISVSPKPENLKLFVDNFRPFYELGVRNMTMIMAHWVPEIKKEFPNCFIKSSIVRPVRNAQFFVDYGLLGYDSIQVDRDLIRNQRELSQIVRAQEFLEKEHSKRVTIGLLANEVCRGQCSMRDEHYLYNVNREEKDSQYMFSDFLCGKSCGEWRKDEAYDLKMARIPPYRKEWDDLLGKVQYFKLHGRDSVELLNNSLEVIKNYATGKEIINPPFARFISENVIPEKVESWIKTVRNCQTQCWRCNLCNEIIKGE